MEPWIDFLPQEYRQRRRRLRRRWQQGALVAGAIGLAAVSVLWQQWRCGRLARQVESARNRLQICRQESGVLQEHRRRLRRSQAQAALCAYLHRGWSRSRTLAFLLHALPDEVRLVRVDFSYQKENPAPGADRPAARRTATGDTAEDGPGQVETEPAAEDMQQLQQEQQQRRLWLFIEGTAADYDQVQRLMVQLRTISALERLQLLEVESDDEGRLAFRIQGRFRPEFPDSPAGRPNTTGGRLPAGNRLPRRTIR